LPFGRKNLTSNLDENTAAAIYFERNNALIFERPREGVLVQPLFFLQRPEINHKHLP
jgi:hypothetical protein